MNPQLPVAASPVAEEIVDFPELWRTLNHHKWRVLGIAVLAAIAGTMVAYSIEPVYNSHVSILIEARANRPVQVQEIYDPGMGTEEYYNTQGELLKSRELIGRVVDRLNLTTNPEILPPGPTHSFLSDLLSLSWLPFLPNADESAPVAPETAEHKRERAIDSVLSHVGIQPIPRSQIIVVYVWLHSPELAAAIANAHGDAFVESGMEARLQVAEHATRWLTDRLSDLKTKLEISEQGLQAYLEKNGLVNVGGTRGLFEEAVTDTSRKLRDAQNRKTQLASTYWKIQQAGTNDATLGEVSALLLDPVVQHASENLLQSEQAVKQLEERYGSRHPQMATALARLDAARRSYYNQLRLAANGVKAEYEIAAETERTLLAVVQTGKDQIRKLDQRQSQQKALEREVQTNRDLYDLFLKRLKETDTTSTYDSLNARVVDRAVPSRFPSQPNKPKIILLWALGGLVFGVVLAALRHLLSETIRSPEQLEQLTQLPVLCVLPPVQGLGRKLSAPMLCLQQPRAPFSEGVRSIRASLYLSDVDRRMKRIMFTSASPQEGKSSLASGFAVTLGQMERVLLLDADLRAPVLKKHFGIPKDAPGLAELLTGQAKLEDVIFHHAPSGISVLPVSQLPANPAEVIASAAFLKLLETLGSRFDRLVFDSPPCQVASDSLLLANRMDAVIFVIHGGLTGHRAVQTAIKQLRAAQAPLLGHVLNQVDARKAYGYRGQYYVYGYGEH